MARNTKESTVSQCHFSVVNKPLHVHCTSDSVNGWGEWFACERGVGVQGIGWILLVWFFQISFLFVIKFIFKKPFWWRNYVPFFIFLSKNRIAMELNCTLSASPRPLLFPLSLFFSFYVSLSLPHLHWLFCGEG